MLDFFWQKNGHSLRTWKLRDPAVAKEFAISLNAKLTAAQVMNFPTVEEIWAYLKMFLLETSLEVCGTSLSHQWKRQTCWWNACRVKSLGLPHQISYF